VRSRHLALLLLLAGCGAGKPIPETDLLLDITPGAFEVEPGEPFPLTVTRVWKKDLVPPEWSDKVLAPLAVKLEEETRIDDGTRIEETRRYVAHAFSLKDMVVRPTKLVAQPKEGGPERRVTATGFRIHVNPVLDPESPGPPDLPGEPPPSRRWMWGGLGGLAVVDALVLFLALRRRKKTAPAPPVAPAPPPVPPRERALARLRVAEEAADVLREYIAEAKGLRALEMTSEELLLAEPSQSLANVLLPCDLVKFAGRTLSEPERAAILASAEAYLG